MPEDVSIGVIGAGGIFRRRHFPALSAMDDVRIAAIANRSAESAREIAAEFDLDADVGDDPEGVIDRDDVDAVMVGTWPYKHHPYGMAALDAGKHTFLQARMAMNLREAKELYAKAREVDVATQICPSPFAMAYDPVVRELLDDGYVGDVYEVHGRHLSGGAADPEEPLHWRQIERYQGLNALSVGIRAEVIHRWLGRAESVSARAETFVEERPLRDGEGTGRVERPDSVTVTARLENGALATVAFSNVDRHAPDDRVEIYGSDGTLVYDGEQDALLGATAGDDGLSEISVSDEETAEWTVEADFVDAIRNGGSPRATFREGVDYMEFTEAVFRSVETGGRVNLPLTEAPSVR